jgi:hypothetical protein
MNEGKNLHTAQDTVTLSSTYLGVIFYVPRSYGAKNLSYGVPGVGVGVWCMVQKIGRQS